MLLPPKGKILGVDYGLRRIGLAMTDVDRTMVFPRPILQVTSREQVFGDLNKLCHEDGVVGVALGLPYDDAHVENEQTQKVRAYGEDLSRFLALPVFYEDEKYTTAEAEAMMDQYGFDYKEKKTQRDSIAAMLILQSYLSKV